jgi:hypothetical protein
MTTIVKETTEIIGGKEYPLTITKQVGYQEILVRGELVSVEEVTLFDSPLGHSRCYTRARPVLPPEERERNLRRVLEVATQAMIDQGIW